MDDDNLRSGVRSPISYALNDAVIYGEHETKRPAINTEISAAASTSASLQYSQSPRAPEYKNASNSNNLRPPNSHTLNDTVVCGAVEAKRSARNIETSRAHYPEKSRTSEHNISTDLTRTHLIRYRKKKHDYMLRLEAETRILREQIKNLTQRRGSLCKVDSTKDNVWNVAVDYFKHFRFGLQAVGQFTAP
ncbi:hypothetical protein GN244_ATG06063 [Phytophthora infestans]|uniref:BZIP domain-containing protein n=1 Tax=Phytophthora infestans TaxID=4787 RepID=A0A833TF47_PHYIN|nr:hypothetical protein GN244_ATG06063 [Phytophthora infestans]